MEANKPRGTNRLWRVTGVVAIGVLVFATAASLAFPTVPDVRGMSRRQTTADLEKAGLHASFAVFPDERNVSCFVYPPAPGTVVGQDPCPGPHSRVIRGSTVTVWIYQPAECRAPPEAGCAWRTSVTTP